MRPRGVHTVIFRTWCGAIEAAFHDPWGEPGLVWHTMLATHEQRYETCTSRACDILRRFIRILLEEGARRE
jgi:hypothetical protein